VVYGDEFGIDLEGVAKSHDTTPDHVVRMHSAGDYRVAMLGFTPGFTYLSGLNASLATSRRQSPRASTPAGTISIGGQQAGIQCLPGPSGWHLLGRTPVRTFHPNRNPMFLIEPGDRVSFFPIDRAEFSNLERMAEKGEPVAQLIES
jgi:5-oxoprolinase (ATP-hydrolysing) subunit B